MTISEQRLRALVTEDRRIEGEAQNATLALMEHRYNAAEECGSAAEYARALGIHARTVQKYVAAWTKWQEDADAPGPRRTPSEVLDLASRGAEEAIAIQAVADAKGIGTRAARASHKPSIDRVKLVMADEPDPERKVEKANRYAAEVEKTRARQSERTSARRTGTMSTYMDIERELLKARRAFAAALKIAVATPALDGDYVEMLSDSLSKSKALLDLVGLAIVGTVDVDWDAELTKMGGEA